MTSFKKILCPVDLSDNSLAAVELATAISKQYDSQLVFIYVAPQWPTDDGLFDSDYIREMVAEDKKIFLNVRPTDDSVGYDHIFVHGNPGPEIVSAAKSCDLIVLSTHGHSGVMRLLMGSVAHYTMRNATCPVVTFKNAKSKKVVPQAERQGQRFVTDVMRHVPPIQGFDKIEKVVEELDRANESGAPVVDVTGCCIGILTKTDINRYLELQERFKNRDPAVIDEIFETDEFGQRRASNLDFDQVHRHMTSPVVTISNTNSCQQAREVFESNDKIHHLVVVDDANQPIGIVAPQDVSKCKNMPSSA